MLLSRKLKKKWVPKCIQNQLVILDPSENIAAESLFAAEIFSTRIQWSDDCFSIT